MWQSFVAVLSLNTFKGAKGDWSQREAKPMATKVAAAGAFCVIVLQASEEKHLIKYSHVYLYPVDAWHLRKETFFISAFHKKNDKIR